MMDGLPGEQDLPVPGRQYTHNRPDGRCFPRTVPAQQGYNLSLGKVEGNVINHLQIAISRSEVLDYQQAYSPFTFPK
jgi:hypothetical protein